MTTENASTVNCDMFIDEDIVTLLLEALAGVAFDDAAKMDWKRVMCAEQKIAVAATVCKTWRKVLAVCCVGATGWSDKAVWSGAMSQAPDAYRRWLRTCELAKAAPLALPADFA